ncbi:MAG: hypothetical protein QOJ42_788, partial [Acidobacteriaceae bacterium]|nr:hypothetical protein [Acidobacteriaceae bacterium]
NSLGDLLLNKMRTLCNILGPLVVARTAAGILTTNCLLPPASYTSDRPEPAPLIQKGGLLSDGNPRRIDELRSVPCAFTEPSETKLAGRLFPTS